MLNRSCALVGLREFVVAVAITFALGSPAAAQVVISGTSDDLDEYRSAYATSLPENKRMTDVLAVAIASDDRVYTWYGDGTVTVGTTDNLSAHEAPRPVTFPPGKSPSALVAAAIAKSDDHVYAWYTDGTVSSGPSRDLARYKDPVPFALPDGMTPYDIVGVGIARNDRVYAWYRDGTASQGRSWDLGSLRGPYDFSMAWRRTPGQIVDIDIAGSDDHVYAFLDAPLHLDTDSNFCHGHDRVTGRTSLAAAQSTAKLYARRKWRERVRWLMPGSPGQTDWEQARERSYDCDRKAGTWRCTATAIPCAGWP